MSSPRLCALLALGAAALGCHPLSPWHAPGYVTDEVPRLAARGPRGPSAEVEILVDALGVPHIFGATEADLAYGLGFAHGRDRRFQVEVVRHAAWGRLAELFGEALLPVDQELRLISLAVPAHARALSKRDRALAEAYAAGLDDGHAHAGRTSEMKLIGLEPAPYTVEDAVAIGLFQAWQLSQGLTDELAREQILLALPAGDPRREALLAATSAGGVPVVGSGLAPTSPAAPPASAPPGPSSGTSSTALAPSRFVPPPAPREAPEARALLAALGLDLPGASNSWAVDGAHTQSGHPILCNDPHLAHRAPSVFYLAHLEHPGGFVAGATFPGLPTVLIGYGRHVAWGMTSSYADVQDLVRVVPDPARTDRYLVDGQSLPFGKLTQTFRVKGEDTATSQVWRTTIFGPVLPPAWVETHGLPADYALMWAGFDAELAGPSLLSSFWDLALAKDVDAAERAVGGLSIAAQNVLMAFTDGTIAYRLGAAVPVRTATTAGFFAARGDTSRARWLGILPVAERPALTRPGRGFAVAANQRVVDDDGPAIGSVGRSGATPYRARRITERIEALLARGKATPERLLEIQQDPVSPAARELAPILGAACPARVEGHPTERVTAFCRAIARFDGAFTVEATGAAPYLALYDALRGLVLDLHLGGHGKALDRARFLDTVLESALVGEAAGRPSPLFDDPRTPAREGLDELVARVLRSAMDRVVDALGDDPEDWAWGEAQRLSIDGPLAMAAVIGGWWKIDAGPQAGWRDAPRAEVALPGTTPHGAALRLVAELSEPPVVRLVIDTGNSGQPGEDHWDDQTERWARGEPRALETDRGRLSVTAIGRLVLLPPAAPSAP